MTLSRWTPWALSTLLLLGCPPVQEAGGQVELLAERNGETFAPENGASMALVAGRQGGWHLDVGVRLRGMEVDRLEGSELRYEAWEAGLDQLWTFETPLAVTGRRFRAEGEWLVRRGDRAILDIADPSDVVGRELDLVVALRTADGQELQAVRTVRVLAPR